MFSRFTELRKAGYTLEAIAREMGRSLATVTRWNSALKEGRTVRVCGDKSNFSIRAEHAL
jgi:hypothetical protein